MPIETPSEILGEENYNGCISRDLADAFNKSLYNVFNQSGKGQPYYRGIHEYHKSVANNGTGFPRSVATILGPKDNKDFETLGDKFGFKFDEIEP